MPDLCPEPPSRPRDVPFPAPKVAALFVEYRGVYFNRSDVVPEGYAKGNDQDGTTKIVRDARHYDGPWPVVAHPPCNRWGSFARVESSKRFKIGADDGCFECALRAVRKWGGVIEHPAASLAWSHFKLSRPAVHRVTSRDPSGGFSFFVNQSQYGHLCQKPTWVYVCGYRDDFEEEFYIPQTKKRVKYGISFMGAGCQRRYPKKTLLIDPKLRKKTPELFADLLVSIAKRCTFYRDHWSCHV